MANETLTSAFSDIADAIRAKGVTGTMTPLQMPTKIGSIPTGSGTLYGISGNSIVQEVDANGVLNGPNVPFVFGSEDIKRIGSQALEYRFYGNNALREVNLPNLSAVAGYGCNSAFYSCHNISSVSLPKLKLTYQDAFKEAFRDCTRLETVDMPMLSSVGSSTQAGMFISAFYGCTSLKRVNLKKLSYVAGSALENMLNGCTHLELVDFSEATAVPQLGNTNTFSNTNETFKVLVPAHLYTTWKSATNWSTYANHIVPYGFSFVVDSGTYAQIYLDKHGNAPTVHLDYSLDGGSTWTYWADTSTPIVLDGVSNTMVSLRPSEEYGPNTAFGTSASDYNQFILEDDEGSQSVSISAFGSATFLLDKDYATSATLPDYCFYHLFENNAGLATAPRLPSTSLGQYCYSGMFKGCSALEKGPDLPATTLATGCYNEMFSGCNQFNYVKIDYTGSFSTDYFYNWLYDVASEGDVIYSGTDTTRGPSGIPVGWNPFKGLKFTAREANSTVSMAKSGNAPTVSLQYSTNDGLTWSPFVVGTTTVTLANIDDTVCVRAASTNRKMSNSFNTDYNYFVMTGKVKASGNINSLLNMSPDLAPGVAQQYAYVNLFHNCTSLVDAKNLTLPCTSTSSNAYGHMFDGCSNLVSGPEIFATTLGNFSLEYMFNGCSVLNEVKLHYIGSINGGSFQNWMTSVQTTSGTFYYNGSSTTRGPSAIPYNWTITTFS